MNVDKDLVAASATPLVLAILADGDDDPTQRVLDAISQKYVDDAIVRVRVKLPEEVESRLNETAIRNALAAAHHVAGVNREVVRSRRTRIAPEAS